MKVFVTLMILIPLISCTGSREKSDEARAHLHLKVGSKYLIAGHYPEALKELNIAERFDPENAEIQHNLGVAYYVRGKYVVAKKKFIRAVQLNPKYTKARNNLGQTFVELHQYDRAIEVLTKATEDLTFKFPEMSWANLGKAYFKKEDFPSALVALRKSLEIRPQSCETLVFYGRALFEQKDFKKSALALEQAIPICKKKNPALPKYYSAISQLRIGKKRAAIARLEEILSLSKNDIYWDKANKLLKLIQQ